MKVSENQSEFEHKDVYRNLMYSKGDYRFKGENGFDDAVGACTQNPNFTPSTEPEPVPPVPPVPPTPTEPYWGLTFTAVEANSTVKMIKVGEIAPNLNLQYSLNNGNTWDPFIVGETEITLAKVGDKVCLAATDVGNTSTAVPIEGDENGAVSYNKFVMTGKIAASGDISSLLDNSQSVTDLTDRECTYSNLFYSCESLTTAPSLPATTLAFKCYERMFIGCSSLITAPVLPATTLAAKCYAYMFAECASLTSAPLLPATTLDDFCYNYMFSNCTSLNYVDVKFTDWGHTDATYNWLNNVAQSGTFKCPAELDTTNRGSNSVPEGWTIDQTA